MRIFLLAIGALAAMSLTAYADDAREYTLDNGLKAILKPNHNAPVVNFNVVYRVGSKYERPGITGISHLLEHMMFKTTKNLPLGEFDRRLKAVGADNNAYTWLDQTVYYETISAEKVDLVLELEAERMQNLLCLEVDHALEMTVVRNELDQRDDTPFTLLYEELISRAFTKHPYRFPTIGTIEDVEAITAGDIREYYGKFYKPDNAFIVAVGDFDPDRMAEKIEAYFGSIPPGNVELPEIHTEPAQSRERRFEISRTGQLDFVMGAWHIPESEHPDSYALVVLGNILGQGRTSRLYKALVDTGKCASAQAWSSAFGYADPFLFFFALTCSPGIDPVEIEPLAYLEIDRIINEGVSREELDRALKQARASFIFDKDSVEREARAVIDFELMRGWRDIDSFLPGIEAVTSEDIQRVCSKYLIQSNRTVGTYRATREDSSAYSYGGLQPGEPGPPSYRLGTGNGPATGLGYDWAEGVTTQKLANGLRVVIKENHSNQTVSVSGRVCAGRIDDPKGLEGLGSFTVNMLDSGTSDNSKEELAALMENSAIDISFTPGRESLAFSARCLSEDFEQCLGLISEQLLRPTFPREEMELVRSQMSASLLYSSHDTFDEGLAAGRNLLYGEGHPFSGRVDGTTESLAKVTRDDLLKWYTEYVRPTGAVITIVGDVNPEIALQYAEQFFGQWRPKENSHFENLARGKEWMKPANGRTELPFSDKSNTALLFIGPGMEKTRPDWPAALVANFILGGDFSSRLNDSLRVREGLTYGAFSWVANGMAAGPTCISIQVNPANIDTAEKSARALLEDFALYGPTEEELQQAKEYLVGSFPVRLSKNSNVAAALCEAEYLGKGTAYIQQYKDIVNSVGLADVRAAAAELADLNKLWLVVAGIPGNSH